MERFMFPILLILIVSCSSAYANYVPVYIWGDISDSPSLPSSSAFDMLSSTEFKEQYLSPLSKGKTIVMFIQDTLSSEDLSTRAGIEEFKTAFPNLKAKFNNNPSIILPNVNKPFSEIQSLKSSEYKITEVDANDVESNGIDKKDLQSRILIVYLYPTSGDRFKALQKNDKAMAAILKGLGDSKVVAIYTGMQPIVKPDPDMEALVRRVRAISDLNQPSDSPFLNYTFNGTSCFYAYATNATIMISWKKQNIYEEANITWPPIVPHTDIEYINGTILLIWPFEDTGNFSAITLRLEFSDQTPTRYWTASSFNLSFTYTNSEIKENEYVLNAPYSVGASKGFSFSCQNFTLNYFSNGTADDLLTVTLTFPRFQVQFNPKDKVFSESFDCQTFFTIPLWMGLFVTILFTFILAVGIFMLFEVKTMDRFDDPKGKTISVPITD